MLKKEIISFLVVGGASFLVDIGGFNLFLFLGFGPLISTFLGTSLAIVANFFGNYKVTFSHKGVKSKGRTIVVYAIVAIATLIVNQILMTVGVLLITETDFVALNILRGTVIGLVMIVRFIAFKFFVFI